MDNVRSIIQDYTARSRSLYPLFQVNHVLDSIIMKGCTGKYDSTTVRILRSKKEMAYVEHDFPAHIYAVQDNAPWGLVRISRENRLTSSDTQ